MKHSVSSLVVEREKQLDQRLKKERGCVAEGELKILDILFCIQCLMECKEGRVSRRRLHLN